MLFLLCINLDLLHFLARPRLPIGDVRPYRPFELDDLDFGSSLTEVARVCLNNIDEATRKLDIREYDVVTAWFASVAFVSRTYYPTWDARAKGPFGRGISNVWNALAEIVPTTEEGLRRAQQEAIKIFVRPSSLRPSPEESPISTTERACHRNFPRKPRHP